MKLFGSSLMVVALAVSGCASIEGTRDKSTTAVRSVGAAQIDSVAVLPVKDYAAVQGLSSQIEVALPQGLVKAVPTATVVDTSTFSARLAQAGLVQSYGQWVSGYDASSMLDPRPLPPLQRAAGAHYFLLVRSVYLNREKINAAAAGYTGTVSDANNVWRTDLKASAELLDASTGRVVWKGQGYAENISSKKRDIDLGIIIFNKRSPEVADYLGQLVQSVADGIAAQIAHQPG